MQRYTNTVHWIIEFNIRRPALNPEIYGQVRDLVPPLSLVNSLLTAVGMEQVTLMNGGLSHLNARTVQKGLIDGSERLVTKLLPWALNTHKVDIFLREEDFMALDFITNFSESCIKISRPSLMRALYGNTFLVGNYKQHEPADFSKVAEYFGVPYSQPLIMVDDWEPPTDLINSINLKLTTLVSGRQLNPTHY